MIPLSLVNQIIDLLGYWNIMAYDPSIHEDYDNILQALRTKKLKLELRNAYSKMLHAPTQEARDAARIRYLHMKRALDDWNNGIPF
jgi:hypothetical protein